MKNVTCLSLLVLPICLFAQPKIKRQTTELLSDGQWQPSTRIEHTFDENGHETSRTYAYFDEKWKPSRKELMENDSDGNVLQYTLYILLPDSTGLYLRLERQAIVNEATACVERRFGSLYDEEGGLIQTDEDRYFYSEGCREDSIWSQFSYMFDGFNFKNTSFISYQYDANGNKTVLNTGEINEQTGEVWRMDSAVVWVYDSDNRLIEQNLNNSLGLASRILYEYNLDGTLAAERNYVVYDSVLTLTFFSVLTYQYDNQSFLVGKSIVNTYTASNYTFTEDYSYFNHCDGLPKYEFLGDYGRITYVYTEGVECGLDWTGVVPTIAPNPADDLLTVRWPKMERGLAAVWLFNATGSVVSDYDINCRTDAFELDVSRLPAGIYFLRIEEGKQRFGEKLVVR
ncbi:MAG: T9SS type A sorting domain-containing protein [Saprospiraceae bacterium]|jgi:hypothetical protein|nr:T9SS type A sorting domain-containing protein [Saprospiraceae bacterium]